MNEAHTPEERKLMSYWLEMFDTAMRDAGCEKVSEHTRCCAAFDAGYVCALYVLGPTALQLDDEHPSEKVLRKAAQVAGVDVEPGLLHLECRLVDSARMPSLSAMFQWVSSMRAVVPVDHA